jgi:hypothetical protein
MKTFVIITSFALFSLTNCFSQEEVQGKQKLTKEQKQQQKLAQETKQAQLVDTMIARHRFVLEADYLNTIDGNRIAANSAFNFIAIDSTTGVIQLGRNTGLGTNGVGGVTTEGQIHKYKVTKNTRKNFANYYISINVFTTLGSFDITMHVSSAGLATARLNGIQGYIVEYSGKIVPTSVSEIYKGKTFL